MTHISARGRWLPWVTPWVMAVMSGLLVFFAQMGPSTVGAGPALAAPTTTFGKASHVYDRATQQLSDTPGATNPQDRSSRSSAARAPWEIWVVRHKPVSSGAAEAGTSGGAAAVRLGQAGEDAVRGAYDIGPKFTADIGGRTRIFDGLSNEAVSEVKNVASQAYTQQLKDSLAYAQGNGLRFDLYVRPDTYLTGPLRDAIRNVSSGLRQLVPSRSV